MNFRQKSRSLVDLWGSAGFMRIKSIYCIYGVKAEFSELGTLVEKILNEFHANFPKHSKCSNFPKTLVFMLCFSNFWGAIPN